MNRKQKKAEVKGLKQKCEQLASDNLVALQKQADDFRKLEDEYIDAIRWLKKHLDNGERYVVDRVAVNIDTREYYDMMQYSNIPASVVKEYRDQKVMNLMLKELSKREDLMQKREYPDHVTFYMEVLKLDKQPVPHFNIPSEYFDSNYWEK